MWKGTTFWQASCWSGSVDRKGKKYIRVLLPQNDMGRWAYCLFLMPTSIEASCMRKKEENICATTTSLSALNQLAWHIAQLWMMEFCIVVLPFESVDESYDMTIQMKYLWQQSLYFLLFAFKHFTKWNLEETFATNMCERDKDKFSLHKHRQGCTLWKVEWIQCSEPVKSTEPRVWVLWKLRFSSSPGATVRSQGTPATAKAQPFCPQKEII